jgi:hypothetical protein
MCPQLLHHEGAQRAAVHAVTVAARARRNEHFVHRCTLYCAFKLGWCSERGDPAIDHDGDAIAVLASSM